MSFSLPRNENTAGKSNFSPTSPDCALLNHSVLVPSKLMQQGLLLEADMSLTLKLKKDIHVKWYKAI